MSWPRSEVPWGVTGDFEDTEAVLLNLPDPIVDVVGDKTAKVSLRTPHRLLSLCHIYDAEGNELVKDKNKSMKYTVLLNKSNLASNITENMEEVQAPIKCFHWI